MFASYNHTEPWKRTNANKRSGNRQITHVWRDIQQICNKLWPSHTYSGCTFCAFALGTHSRHHLCHRRVKMQIINPILFQRKAGKRDDLELWVWNPVWIVPNLTWVHWKCVSGLSYGNVRNLIALIFTAFHFTLWWWGCLSLLLELTAN